MSEWRTSFAKIEYEIKKVYKETWPINWNQFSQPKVVLQAVQSAEKPIQIGIAVSAFFALLSILLVGYGLYISLTIVGAASGGQFREAVLQSEVRGVLPVLTAQSETEKKVSALLFRPLYEVSYPNYLQNTTDKPTITPVLLSQEPVWQDTNDQNPDNRYKRLRFTLKENLQWSDSSQITLEDIEYTFNLLSQPNSNPQFRSLFSSLAIEPVPGSEREFDIVAPTPTPQLLYGANFSPIKSDYFSETNLDTLALNLKAVKPMVVSGLYKFPDGPVSDPDDNNNTDKKENPIRNEKGWKHIVLEKNTGTHPDLPEAFIDSYVFTKYDTLKDTGGNTNSIENAAKNGKVDLYSRFTGFNTETNSEEVKNTLTLNQTVQPSNTYYTLFLNALADGENPLLNKFLRQYVLCSLSQLNTISETSNSQIVPVPSNKQFTPIQLGVEDSVECPQDLEAALTEVKSASGAQIYSFFNQERDNIKRVQIYNIEIGPAGYALSFLSDQSSRNTAIGVQNNLVDIGVPVNLISDQESTNAYLARQTNSTYAAALLPVTITSRDVYPLYGINGQDISQIERNANLDSYSFENTVSLYSASDLTNTDAKNALITFFNSEYIQLNIGYGQWEHNFSSRIKGFSTDSTIYTFSEEIYYDSHEWFVDTRRVFA